MKNQGLSKWLRAVNGISLRAKPAPCWGEGRGRELGCKSRNHPSVNHLLPAPIVARGAGGEANPTGLWPSWGCRALPLALCQSPKFGVGPQFPPEGAKQAATAISFGCTGGKAQLDSELASAFSVSIPTSGSRDWGGTQSTRTGFLPQQIEAVNIDNLLFQGFLMPSHT